MSERDQIPPHGSTATGLPEGTTARPGDLTTAPPYATTPIALRRPDALAALLLLLAGIAAGVSLFLDWLTDADASGLDLVRRGIDAAGGGTGELLGSGFWQPLAVVLGGAALLLIGLLVFVPAKTHRFLGAVALVVSLTAAAAVLVPLAVERWDVDRFDIGFWFAVAVPVLGLLGSLKALLTGPKHTARPAPAPTLT